MPERREYEMTEAQEAALLSACKPVPAMWIGGPPRSVQENANDAWAALGRELGFDPMTVQPIRGKDATHFSAVPSETDLQRAERLTRESEFKRIADLAEVDRQIAALQARRGKLTGGPS